jgi:hypothetical protein
MKNYVKVIDGKPTAFYTVVVHKFTVGDVDDPEIYAAEPIWKWQNTDSGKFIMEHATEKPSYHQHIDQMSYGYQYAIIATLIETDYTYWKLKYD